MRRALALALAVPAAVFVPGCGAGEKICEPDEVAIVLDGGGSGCEAPKPDDPTCPPGEILVKDDYDDGAVRGCIPDDYEDGWQDRTPTAPPTTTTPS